MSQPSSYGFIGLGAMGAPMAMNLRQKISSESTLSIFDVSQDSMTTFKASHESYGKVVICGSAKEVVESSDYIISIVPEGKHVEQVFLQPNSGVLSASNLIGKVFIDCSTIDVPTSSKVSSAVTSKGAFFYDAPVSGGTTGATSGTITIMIGIQESDPNYQLVRTILSKMGKNLFACGGPTLGLATKLCNNYISGTIAIATSEGMNLGMRLGLDPKVLSSILALTVTQVDTMPVPGVTPSAPASNDYAPGFKVQLMRKDYNLAIETAKTVNATLLLGEAGLKAYTDASADVRCVDRDSRVIYRFIGGKE